jgi:CheY-like chemotaxis protein
MNKIVVIEDNASDREVVATALREAVIGVEVLPLSNGEEGIAFVTENDPEFCPVSLFILDINLPRHSGHEVLSAIRAGSYRDVPVIIMTSSRRPEDSDTRLLGNAHYFRKPLELDEFLRIGDLSARIMLRVPLPAIEHCKIPSQPAWQLASS